MVEKYISYFSRNITSGDDGYYVVNPYLTDGKTKEVVYKFTDSKGFVTSIGYKWGKVDYNHSSPWKVFLEKNVNDGNVIEISSNEEIYNLLLSISKDSKNDENFNFNFLKDLLYFFNLDYDLPRVEEASKTINSSMLEHYDKTLHDKVELILWLFYFLILGDKHYVIQNIADLNPKIKPIPSKKGRYFRLIAVNQILNKNWPISKVINWSKGKSPNSEEIKINILELKNKYEKR